MPITLKGIDNRKLDSLLFGEKEDIKTSERKKDREKSKERKKKRKEGKEKGEGGRKRDRERKNLSVNSLGSKIGNN